MKELSSVLRPAIPHYRCFQANHRCGGERRKATVIWSGPERRSGADRRQDADWRFAMIRRFNREDRRSAPERRSGPDQMTVALRRSPPQR